MSNNIDYKKLIIEYCEEKGFDEKRKSYLLKPNIYEKKLFELMPFQLGKLILEDMCGLSKNKSSMQGKAGSYLWSNYYYLSGFYDWCIAKGVIPLNPLREVESLSYDNLLFQLSQEVDITVLYKETLMQFSRQYGYNEELYAVIIGLLFDGVANNKDLASLKHSDINLFSGEVISEGRIIPISEFTVTAIKNYLDLDIMYITKENGIEEQPLIQHKDFLFKKIGKYYKSEMPDDKFIKSTSNAIGNYLKAINLRYSDVTRSGFINALREEFENYSDKEFVKLFTTNKKPNTAVAAKIKNVMNVYGGVSIATWLRNCFPYIIKSKYQN